MGCNCGKRRVKRATYLYTSPTGQQKTYTSETQARHAVATKGGKYVPQGG